MRRLVMIRHGETEYSIRRIYCGLKDIPLSNVGIEQAKKLIKRVSKMDLDTVYTSPLKRSSGTAEIIFPDKKIVKRRGLREIDFGKLCGKRYEEVNKLFPGIYDPWAEHPEKVVMPGGESFMGFRERVINAYKRIEKANRKNENVAIVCHGGPISIIWLHIFNKSISEFWKIIQKTASITVIDFKNGKPKAILVNDTRHLNG